MHPELEDTSLLNYGAPRDWRLEFERDLPPIVREYLRFLLAQHQAVAMKFTRMSCKIPVLAEIAPQAKLIHLVRDPRAVAVSYLFGKASPPAPADAGSGRVLRDDQRLDAVVEL